MGRADATLDIDHGQLLIDFTEAAVTGADTLAARRADLVAAVGGEAAAQTVATVSAFSGLVRVADGTGIPIDDGLAAASGDIRSELGLGEYGGAANTTASVAPAPFSSIDDLFAPPSSTPVSR